MLIDAISILVGLAGTVASRRAVARWAERRPDSDPHAYWLAGFVALVPAWLVAFLTLLPTSTGPRPRFEPSALWVLSASAGLIGAIASEARVRAVEAEGRVRPAAIWRLGLLGFAPAWLLALLGHLAG
jgi:hypothetical protein